MSNFDAYITSIQKTYGFIFKDICEVGDTVLIIQEIEGNPEAYNYIYAILLDNQPDSKPNWFVFNFASLSLFPPVVFNWILRENYANGVPFTMQGYRTFIKPIDANRINDNKNKLELKMVAFDTNTTPVQSEPTKKKVPFTIIDGGKRV